MRRGGMQDGDAQGIGRLLRGAVGQQQDHFIAGTGGGGVPQRSAAAMILDVESNAAGEQRFDERDLAARGCEHQGRAALRIGGFGAGSRGEQYLDDFWMFRAHRREERCLFGGGVRIRGTPASSSALTTARSLRVAASHSAVWPVWSVADALAPRISSSGITLQGVRIGGHLEQRIARRHRKLASPPAASSCCTPASSLRATASASAGHPR